MPSPSICVNEHHNPDVNVSAFLFQDPSLSIEVKVQFMSATQSWAVTISQASCPKVFHCTLMHCRVSNCTVPNSFRF